MGTHRTADPDGLAPDGWSRREMLRIGAGGLAVALVTHGAVPARAQKATPTPAGEVSGMPAGVSLVPMGGFPVHDLPTKPFTIRVVQVTLEPGAVVPPGAVTYPVGAHVVAGEVTLVPEGGRALDLQSRRRVAGLRRHGGDGLAGRHLVLHLPEHRGWDPQR